MNKICSLFNTYSIKIAFTQILYFINRIVVLYIILWNKTCRYIRTRIECTEYSAILSIVLIQLIKYPTLLASSKYMMKIWEDDDKYTTKHAIWYQQLFKTICKIIEITLVLPHFRQKHWRSRGANAGYLIGVYSTVDLPWILKYLTLHCEIMNLSEIP